MKIVPTRLSDNAGHLAERCASDLRLTWFRSEDGTVVCSLQFENGAELVCLIGGVEKHTWLRTQPLVTVVVATLLGDMETPHIYSRDFIREPTSGYDILFTMELAVQIRSMAWMVAATEDFGECISLPGRHLFSR